MLRERRPLRRVDCRVEAAIVGVNVFTITIVLALAALIIAILSAIKPVPLWVAVVLLAIVALIQRIPVS